MIYKECSICKNIKLICEFSKNKYMRDGHMYDCRICNREKATNWSINNKEKSQQLAAKRMYKWRMKNPNKSKLSDNNYRVNNPHKVNAKNANRRAKKISATPPWLNSIHFMQIEWFYFAARMMTDTSGIKHHVDHIHPLQGGNFNGLHVPWNLQIIKANDNLSKGNSLPRNLSYMAWEV